MKHLASASLVATLQWISFLDCYQRFLTSRSFVYIIFRRRGYCPHSDRCFYGRKEQWEKSLHRWNIRRKPPCLGRRWKCRQERCLDHPRFARWSDVTFQLWSKLMTLFLHSIVVFECLESSNGSSGVWRHHVNRKRLYCARRGYFIALPWNRYCAVPNHHCLVAN